VENEELEADGEFSTACQPLSKTSMSFATTARRKTTSFPETPRKRRAMMRSREE